MAAKSFTLLLVACVCASWLNAISVMPPLAASTANLASSLSTAIPVFPDVVVSLTALMLSAAPLLSFGPWQAWNAQANRAIIKMELNFFIGVLIYCFG